MSKGITVILSLLVGFLVGWLLFRTPSITARGNHVVSVYGDPGEDDAPSVSPNRLPIPKEDTVSWLASSPNKHTRIEFEEEVFQNMKHLPNGRYLPVCKKRRCDSGTVKVLPDPNKPYKYWQILHNPDGTKEKSKDGWIIIDR
jgi:hypothetical protein